MKVKKRTIIIAVIVVFVLGLAAAVFFNLPKPLSSSDSAYDLSLIADGTYTGSCDNGIIKVQVEVDVQKNLITDIRIIKHQNGLGSAAEAITDDIITYQSIEVDTLSGATMSSRTILKAVENTLSGLGE